MQSTPASIIDNATVEEIREFRHLFELSGGKEGFILIEQFLEFLNNLGADFSKDDGKFIFSILNKPEDEHISFEDFFILSKITPPIQTKQMKTKRVLEEMRLHEKDDVLTENDLQDFLRDSNVPPSSINQTAKEMVEFVDKNSKGYITYGEISNLFANMYKNDKTK